MPSLTAVRLKDLAPERLQRLGYEALYTAVNLDRLVAFVGSGLSLVYGSLTWTDFMDEIVQKTRAALDDISVKLNKSPAATRRQKERVERARHQIALFGKEKGDTVVILEFCRQAFALLEEICSDLELPAPANLHGRAPGVGFYASVLHEIFASDMHFVRKTFDRRLDWWSTAEGTGAKAMSLESLRLFLAELKEKKGGKTASSKVAEEPRIISEFYSLATLACLVELSGDAATTLSKLLSSFKKVSGKSGDLARQHDRLPIDRRSVADIFLAAALTGSKTAERVSGLKQHLWKKLKPNQDRLAPPRPLLDPLMDLHRSMHVGRYLTTNYDLELEHLFMFDDIRDRDRCPLHLDRIPEVLHLRSGAGGAKANAPESAERSSEEGSTWLRGRADGTQVRSDVYDGRSSGRLFEFGIGGTDNSVHIFHLHGRVDRPQTMIATDSDYNRIYRAEDLGRPGFDLAYDVTVAGNPVLVVGSGMTEEELTRTFRQDVSNARARDDGFVMRMASERADALIREQMSLRTKFGLNVIHFGHRRRGAGFCLRRHFILIDLLARKFGIAGDKDLATSDGEYVWKDKCENNAVEAKDGYGPDLEDAECLGILARSTFRELVKTKFPPHAQAGGSTCYGRELALVASLDFDGETVAWLLSSDSEELARRLRESVAAAPAGGTPPAGDDAYHLHRHARRLIADYLERLAEKLVTAAIRIELREVGREANAFYKNRTETIFERNAWLSCGAGRHRHLSDGSGELDETCWQSYWRWREAGGSFVAPGDLRHPLDPILAGRQPEGAYVILGEPGIGKGTFLRWLHTRLASDWLFINCCYGQEADSVISLVEEFIASRATIDVKEKERLRGMSRRERIEQLSGNVRDRLRIVLGGLDRLFGVEGEILAIGIDWLLMFLLDHAKIDLIITGSRRCERYIQSRAAPSGGGRKSRKGQRRPIHFYIVEEVQDPGQRRLGYLPYLDAQWRNQARQAKNLDLHDGTTCSDLAESPDSRAAMALSLARRDAMFISRAIDGLMFDADGRPWRRDFGTLAHEILKALAFIGLPVEGEVVSIAPAVRRALDRLVSPVASSSAGARRHVERQEKWYMAALDLLLERGLVQTIEPYGDKDPRDFVPEKVMQLQKLSHDVRFQARVHRVRADPDGISLSRARHAVFFRRRLVLHRSVTLYLRDRFGVPLSETTLSDCYNLTLFAAQPDDAPAHEPQATADLEQLVDYLIDGWKDVKLRDEEGLMEFRDRLLPKGSAGDAMQGYQADPRTPARLDAWRRLAQMARLRGSLAPASLRAAGGIVRGFFSSANLLGLDIEDRYGLPTPLGAITRHKERIRRMLNTAIEMQRARSGDFLTEVKRSLKTRATLPHARERDPGEYEYPIFDSTLEKDIVSWFQGLVPLKDSDPAHEPDIPFSKRFIVPLWTELAGQMDRAPRDFEAGTAGEIPHNDLERRPFYIEEIVWLQNERGVLALAQGDLYTATTCFHLALRANEAIEAKEYQPNRCRILLNQAVLQIERGKITEARLSLRSMRLALNDWFVRAPRAVREITREWERVLGLIEGYEALCDHLEGMPDRARKGYQAALNRLNKLREQRAIAIFNDRLADLHASYYKDAERALGYYGRALAAAEVGRHTDIVYAIRIHRAALAVATGSDGGIKTDIAHSLQLFDAAINYGSRLDIHRVTVRALSARAELRLSIGDIRAAESDIARAMALAARYGMKLRRISLRVLRGRAYEKLGDFENARFMFERALSEAEAINYQRMVEEANGRLIGLRPSGS